MRSEDLKSGDLKSDSAPFKKHSSNKMLSSLSDSHVLLSQSSMHKNNKSMRSIELLASREVEQQALFRNRLKENEEYLKQMKSKK